MKKYMRKVMMLTLSLAMILSMAVFSSSAALRQTGSTTFTINGVSYACTGYFYTSGTSIYGGSKTDALTYRQYNYNSITYLTAGEGYISKYMGSSGTGTKVTGQHTGNPQPCTVSGAVSVSSWNVVINFVNGASKSVSLQS